MDPARIRLREKTGEDKLTQVYHEQREFNRYQIFDGKEVAIQILPEVSEESDEQREQSHLLMVKAWDPSDWSLSDPVELFIPKQATLSELGLMLAAKFPHIELANIQCTKINSSWNFSRVQLPYAVWTKLENNTDFVSNAPFYVSTDGLFFVIKDASKEIREMTAEEQEMYKSSDFETTMFDGKPILGSDGLPIRQRRGPQEK